MTPEGPRFPGLDVLGESGSWDAVTTDVVLARMEPPGPLRFFTPGEARAAAALFDQLLDQRAEPRVPVLQLVDARLADGQTDGWRHDDMPEDGQAFRLSLAALDRQARPVAFAELGWDGQARLLTRVQHADLGWPGLPAGHVWDLWTRYACTAYYSHPWAWNEIGFPGPAYPRGYGNLGMDRREHWEVADAAPGTPLPPDMSGS